MSWVSLVAIYFVSWWLVLFLVLPFGVKTQADDDNVTLGTVASAPRGPHMRRAVIWTTIITTLAVGGYGWLTFGLGLGFDDIPIMVPMPE
ncbi:DUF1467 family protein [Aquamicrobium segne]|uniref:DUF1467 family protein n=1 Tax=Aquamicrobium segne TaxID=469547 RepID=A0ABW0GVY2_9HYPH